jgi:diaminopimelate epimerase
MAASRAVSSRIGLAEPEQEVIVRNAGGLATVSLRVRLGQWHPVLQGNATFVYRADVDPAASAKSVPQDADREFYPEEIAAYDALDRGNAIRLRTAGIQTSGTAQIT